MIIPTYTIEMKILEYKVNKKKMDKKLDLNGVRIYSNTDNDIKDAIDLIGQEVYMSDYEDFSSCCKHELMGITNMKDDPYYALFPFIYKDEDSTYRKHKYFILAKDARFIEEAKPKKLRPFKDIDEFANETDCCEVGNDGLFIRSKKAKQEGFMIYSGYIDSNGLTIIHLGAWTFSLYELFENWEYKYGSDSEWLPFGVEDEA